MSCAQDERDVNGIQFGRIAWHLYAQLLLYLLGILLVFKFHAGRLHFESSTCKHWTVTLAF
jgi:hypothetical protein